jgi:hypothetical protein
MSKLKELVSKGVRLIVADTEAPRAAGSPAADRDLPPETFSQAEPRAVTRSEVPADVGDFDAVYQEAGIRLAAHGYGIEKVAEMLGSKRLATLSREVKATAVLAALEAAGVPMRDVIQDAVLRDKALDAFEIAKEREVEELHVRTAARIKAIRDEIDALLKEKNAEMDGLKGSEDAASQAFRELQVRKRREEERLHDLVAHFLEGAQNPITTSPGGPASPPPPPKSGQA